MIRGPDDGTQALAAIGQLPEGPLHWAVLGFHDEQPRRHAVHGQHRGNLHDSRPPRWRVLRAMLLTDGVVLLES
jgi:hypothetical protein